MAEGYNFLQLLNQQRAVLRETFWRYDHEDDWIGYSVFRSRWAEKPRGWDGVHRGSMFNAPAVSSNVSLRSREKSGCRLWDPGGDSLWGNPVGNGRMAPLNPPRHGLRGETRDEDTFDEVGYKLTRHVHRLHGKHIRAYRILHPRLHKFEVLTPNPRAPQSAGLNFFIYFKTSLHPILPANV